VPAGQSFTYKFIVPDAGTYWAHPHVGVELDTGLYLPLIVDDPALPQHLSRRGRNGQHLRLPQLSDRTVAASITGRQFQLGSQRFADPLGNP
jgi:FtsP/CotA-like multicopper oxidase with cupredoxin domain